MPNNTNAVTAETITTAQIKALREEAYAAGDYAEADICALALAAHETADSEGGDLIGPDGKVWTRTMARAALADTINAARAME